MSAKGLEPQNSAGQILIVDHRLDGLIEWIDRVVVLGRDGRIATAGL